MPVELEPDDAPVVVLVAAVVEVELEDVPVAVPEVLAPVVDVDPVDEPEAPADDAAVLAPVPTVDEAADEEPLPPPTALPHPAKTSKAKPIERRFTEHLGRPRLLEDASTGCMHRVGRR